ncbi:WD40 repeat domain-containing protein [Embleya sp. NBC_00896]|uniref:WD40 repeat domain-containing protein n=1 Tax=Embleya sp. NBC_00896 TaxID=2975961 RepID=UPI0038708F9F|nr:WD40 repeat domain-containing protein [Embleya sp. NBC_00896]
MGSEQITLVQPDSTGPKYRRFELLGAEFVRSGRTGSGKARETRKEFPDPKAATVALRREVWKALRAGFVRLGTEGESVALQFLTPRKATSRAMDLHPDGSSVVIGCDGAILLVDVATGSRRTVFEVPEQERGGIFHATLFDASGECVVYTIEGRTRRLDLATGRDEAVAGFTQFDDSRFNPYCVRPSWDRARERLVVFDAGDLVRVLDAAGEPVCEVSTASPTTECRTAALSASGRLLAVSRVSRGVVYGHRDALADTTNEVEVWDVASGRLVTRVPLAWDIGRVGFDPTETLLVMNRGGVHGPYAISIETGDVVWQFTNPFHPNILHTCYGWSYTPDGGRIAVGGNRTGALRLYDADLREPSGVDLDGYDDQRVSRLVFSRTGDLLATGGDFGLVYVRRIPPPAG